MRHNFIRSQEHPCLRQVAILINIRRAVTMIHEADRALEAQP